MIPTLAPCEYPVPLRNVAEGQPTFQSSDKPKKDGGSEKAVDGNKDSDLKSGNSCTWTDDEFEPYWQVDLGRTYDIYEVVITTGRIAVLIVSRMHRSVSAIAQTSKKLPFVEG
ncbi:fucolectin-like [Ptychodera flava]|uniref:fucolectin-like n=1 Tax=Ptychodera flava TaxID=63121 RepID=UPI003969C8CE